MVFGRYIRKKNFYKKGGILKVQSSKVKVQKKFNKKGGR
jgi:hypothetical protein